MKTFEELQLLGIDTNDAMKRFIGDEKMFREFLTEFFNDINFKRLYESLEKNDLNKAFDAAHTLKGVASNLSLNSFNKVLIPIVEKLRKGSKPSAREIQRLKEIRKYLQDNIR